MTDEARETWETYTSSWKAVGVDDKRRLLDRSAEALAVYTDPLVQTQTRDELIAYMLDFHTQVPGGHFETQWFLAHHDRGVARWTMKGGNGMVLGEGISYCEFNAAGKLTAMTGFFESPQSV